MLSIILNSEPSSRTANKEFPLKHFDRREAEKLELKSKEYKDTFKGA
jgi:hypothetical protein